MSSLSPSPDQRSDAEVGNCGTFAVFVPQHIRRFHVAMNDAATVRGGECGSDVADDALRNIEREWAREGEPFGHAAAAHVLHDEVRRAVRQLADAVDGDDVGMRDGGDGLGFAAEPRVRLGVGTLRLHEHLHSDEALQLRVAGQVDTAHPSLTDSANQEDARAKCFLKRDGNGVVLQRVDGRTGDGLAGRTRLPRHYRLRYGAQ